MTHNKMNDLLGQRGFRIIADASGKYKPLDAIAQFEYKGFVISISTAGLSVGACSTEIAVFEGGMGKQRTLVHTVEEAIAWVDEREDVNNGDIATKCEMGSNFQQLLLNAAKSHNHVYAVRLLVQTIEGILTSLAMEEESLSTLLRDVKKARHFNEGYVFGGFDDNTFNSARRLEVCVQKLSDYFIQLEMLLSNLGEAI